MPISPQATAQPAQIQTVCLAPNPVAVTLHAKIPNEPIFPPNPNKIQPLAYREPNPSHPIETKPQSTFPYDGRWNASPILLCC
jgi:hypothetical protein